MIYGCWALACARRWGAGVRGAFITAEAEQHLTDRRSGPALTRKVCPHALVSLCPTLHQPGACRDIGARQKKNLPKVVRCKDGVSGSGNPLATEGEGVLGKLLFLFSPSFPLGICCGQPLETGYWARGIFGLSQGGCFHVVFC